VVGLDLTEIEGISEMTALTIISEIGPGVSRFATVKKFCSWLGLCPQWQKSGGRVKSSRTRRGVNRAAQALRLAAQSLHHSQGALGGFLRRMKGRLGTQAAVTATAHKVARIVYLALKHGMTYGPRQKICNTDLPSGRAWLTTWGCRKQSTQPTNFVSEPCRPSKGA
jgi:hypothetical protein